MAFDYRWQGEARRGFVLNRGGELRAFANFCPHWKVDLDMGDGRLYSAKIDRIFCQNHGATFDPDSGQCDAGPCVGQGLLRFRLALDGDDARVEITSDPYED